MMARVLCVVAMLLATPLAASAGLIGIEWRGTITEHSTLGEAYMDVLPLGTELAIAFSIDPTSPNLCGDDDPFSGLYSLSPATLSIFGETFHSHAYAEMDAPAGNCLTPISTGVTFRFPAAWAHADSDSLVPGTLAYSVAAALGASSMTALDAYYGVRRGAIPTFPEVDPFFSHFSGGLYGADGYLTATAPVPEPGTWILVGSGVLAAWRQRRRRSARSSGETSR
jgi:hypothetical protein